MSASGRRILTNHRPWHPPPEATHDLLHLVAVHPPFKESPSHYTSSVTTNGESLEELELDGERQEVVGVLGSGDYGRAIAGRLAQAGYTVLIGSRDPTNPQIL